MTITEVCMYCSGNYLTQELPQTITDCFYLGSKWCEDHKCEQWEHASGHDIYNMIMGDTEHMIKWIKSHGVEVADAR